MRPLDGRSWLDPRVRVADSEIEGRGLFATQHIGEGEVVAVLGGRIIDDAELARLAGHRYSSAAIDEGAHLLMEDDDPLSCGNHSCDSNLWMRDEVTLAARRDIGPGEELTIDYALLTGPAEWRMEPCACGSSACRLSVTGEDWRLLDVQRRYAGHFSPFIQRRIALTGAAT